MVKAKQLSDAMLEALTQAKTSIRTVHPMIPVTIVDIYEIGEDKRTGDPIQPLEVQVEGEDSVRNYVIKGADTITSIFGKAKNGKLANVEYDAEGTPLSMKVPDCNADDTGTRWFQLKKA
jgi:hypothetical protein